MLLTLADRLLSSPGQGLLALTRLRAHQLIARITQEMNLVTRQQNFPHLLAIGRCLQLWTGDC